MADSTGRKQRKRIEYLETLALKQAALLKALLVKCKVPDDLARSIKEVTAAAGMIRNVQATRAASKTQLEKARAAAHQRKREKAELEAFDGETHK